MSHLYPLADTADEALNAPKLVALTRYEAEALAGEREVVKLETEWITPDSGDARALIEAAESGPGRGYVQHYENEAGAPILAVTYWKLGKVVKKPATKPAETKKPKDDEDHTDDLYFRAGRTKPARKRGRKKYVDPRQMDMFQKPDSADE